MGSDWRIAARNRPLAEGVPHSAALQPSRSRKAAIRTSYQRSPRALSADGHFRSVTSEVRDVVLDRVQSKYNIL